MGDIPLAPDENVVFRSRVSGFKVVLTDKRVILASGSASFDIRLDSIYSVEVRKDYRLVFYGAALVILSLAASLLPAFTAIAAVVFVIGLALAVYGWVFSHKLTIHYGMKRIDLKGRKTALIKLAEREMTAKEK